MEINGITDKTRRSGGFSLIEINMAIFVMAVGILSLVVLYPLGLRESTQGAADLKQSMFADCMLNQAVAAATHPEVTWSKWKQWANKCKATQEVLDLSDSVPDFIDDHLNLSSYEMTEGVHYKIVCCLVPGFSDRLMGIYVQSTDQIKDHTREQDFPNNNTIYYAEAMFQGKPE